MVGSIATLASTLPDRVERAALLEQFTDDLIATLPAMPGDASPCWRKIGNGANWSNWAPPDCYDCVMTMACLCEVDRPGLAAALAIRGFGVQRTGRATIATFRPPAGSVLVAALSAGDSDWSALRRLWRGALLVMIPGSDQAALADALDAGADDAVCDGTGDALIAARVAALARRRSWPVLTFGSLEIDPIARAVTRAGRPLDLLPREYAVLLMLAEANGAVVGRIALRDQILGRRFDTGTNVIEVHLSRLRAKLDRGFTTPLIVTERGCGYRLIADDEPIAAKRVSR